ncbi:hypothetical protein CPB84DRAFT_1850843, partial [Gymnopilus junonius]
MMQRPHQDLQPNQQSRSYGHYTDSNPSSTHSSPRSYPSDLENFYPTHPTSNLAPSQTYPIPAGASLNPYIPAQQRRPHPHMQASRSSSYSSYNAPALQVSTSTSSAHEHDPNERTARPGNAHLHAQFHSALSAAAAAASSSNSMESGPGALSGDPTAMGNAEAGESDSTGGQQTDYTSSTPG